MIRRIFIVILFLLLVSLFLIPAPWAGEKWGFNPITGLSWCKTHSACLRVQAYRMDKQKGWISHSKGFSDATYMFVTTEMIVHDTDSPSYRLANTILRSLGEGTGAYFWQDNQSNVYATIYEFSDGKLGKIPPIFQPFYEENNNVEPLKVPEFQHQSG